MMVGSNIVTYTDKFSDLSVLCPRIVTPECKKIKRYIWDLTAPIQGDVLSSNLATFDSAKCLTQRIIDHGVHHGMEVPVLKPSKGEDYKRKSRNKRKKKQTTQETPQ